MGVGTDKHAIVLISKLWLSALKQIWIDNSISELTLYFVVIYVYWYYVDFA